MDPEKDEEQVISTPVDSCSWEDRTVEAGELEPGVNTTVRMEGPYFTPANPERFKTVVCLVAGTGLSGAIAIAAAFRAQKTGFVANSKASKSGAVSAPPLACTVPPASLGRWQRCIVIWTVREKDYAEMPFFDGKFSTSTLAYLPKLTLLSRSRL